jgi:hypothetical protein
MRSEKENNSTSIYGPSILVGITAWLFFVWGLSSHDAVVAVWGAAIAGGTAFTTCATFLGWRASKR